MPSIDRSTVRKVASLARLRFGADEEERLVHDLGRILEHVAKLEAAPPADGAGGNRRLTPLREDLARAAGVWEAFLEHAPDRRGPAIRVPVVLDGEDAG